jgi:hypothetical protein
VFLPTFLGEEKDSKVQTKSSTHAPRAPGEGNLERQLLGPYLRGLREELPRQNPGHGKRSYDHMTIGEAAVLISNHGYPIDASVLSKVECGKIRPAPWLLEIIGKAYRLDPHQQRMLEELNGYPELRLHLLRKRGIQDPPFAHLASLVHEGVLRPSEVTEVMEGWERLQERLLAPFSQARSSSLTGEGGSAIGQIC